MGYKQDQAYEAARQADIAQRRGDPRFNTYLKKRRQELAKVMEEPREQQKEEG